MFAHPKRGALDYSVDPKYMPDGTKVKCSIGECLHKGNNGITFKAAGMSLRCVVSCPSCWAWLRNKGGGAAHCLRVSPERL